MPCATSRHHLPAADGHPRPQVYRALRRARWMSIGAKVTLRGDRMWEFLDRLTAVAIPRIRGLPLHLAR